VTAENEMKWDTLQPSSGQFNYGNADRIVSFAEQNGMAIKGHTLVWYSQLPSWVSSMSGADRVRQTMLNHITQVMTHYRGKLHAWDVVNEAWQDDGLALRNNVFLQNLGEGYIDEAFEAARAADPGTKLYYNDYGTEGMSAKANAVYEMVRGMKERGVPIDGVGLQMHTRKGNGAPSVSEFVQNLSRLAALGLEVVISEMDVVLCGSEPIAERLETQKSRYHDLVEACVQEPACKAITIWGISDRHSWLNNAGASTTGCQSGDSPRGLLLDDNYQKKPAYAGVVDALLGR
jgi:endo-1,4-beta-xylanase